MAIVIKDQCMKNFFIWVVILLTFQACKQDLAFTNPALIESYAALNKEKSDKNIESFTKALDKAYAETKTQEEKVNLLNAAVKTCNLLGLQKEENKYAFALLNDDFNSKNTPRRLFDYAEKLIATGKSFSSEIIYSGIVDNFPESNEANLSKKKTLRSKAELKQILMDQSKMIYANSNQFDSFKASDFVNNAESWSVAFPKDTSTATILFMAAEVARAASSWTKSLSLYTSLIYKYPNHNQAPIAMFIKGFILETQLKDSQNAVKTFKEFIALYPNHSFVDDAQFLLENAGKDDDDLLKEARKGK